MVGSIHDSLLGEPLIKAEYCVVIPAEPPHQRRSFQPCAPTDARGHFLLEGLPRGRYEARWFCWGRQWIGFGRWLGVDTLVVESNETIELNLLVDGTGCDQEPIRVRRGQFAGHYSYGFEHSRFRLEELPEARIWVELGSVDWSQWPDDLVETDVGYPCVYVEWIGKLRGPGYYGHMTVSDHQFTVDSIIGVRAAESSECDR